MKVVIYLTLISSLIISCKPQEEVTNFNRLIEAPIGEDLELQMQEDQELEIDYSIPENEDSIDLQIAIHTAPTNGQLLKCDVVEVGRVNCLYKPNQDFFGTDTFQVIAKDGDVKAEKASTVKINIINVPDAPRALDTSFTIGSRQELIVTFPEGIDPDSLSTELTYTVVDQPSNGQLTDCNGRTCKYISDSLFDGVDTLTYQIKDSTGLTSNTATVDINVNRITFNTSETFNSEADALVGVDIVWVIDNSGSMEDEQANLRNNFNAFINNFLVNGRARFKFNMAVTVTDLYRRNISNSFALDQNGNQFDLSSTRAEADFAAFSQDFTTAVNVGINGSGDELALRSIETAYNRTPTWYAGNDHLLAYIILSDEPEQSTEKTIQQWFTDLTAIKDSPSKVLFYPIINPNNDGGNRYAQLANLAGSQTYNINNSFQNILDNISLNVSAAIKSYPLNAGVAIVPSSVKVTINGVPTTAFTYANNSITLTNPPQGTARIVVNYDYGAL